MVMLLVGLATGGQKISGGGEPAAPEHHRPKKWRTFGAFWLFVYLCLFRGTSGLYWTLHKYPEDPAMTLRSERDHFAEGSEGTP